MYKGGCGEHEHMHFKEDLAWTIDKLLQAISNKNFICYSCITVQVGYLRYYTSPRGSQG